MKESLKNLSKAEEEEEEMELVPYAISVKFAPVSSSREECALATENLS